MNVAIKNKKGNVIHRTTSETLRLRDADFVNNHSGVGRIQSTSLGKKKSTSTSCSFQITGISLTRSDAGDDSADDLDESHTDDISRITDNETPSISEDSKDTDDYLIQPNIYHSNNPENQSRNQEKDSEEKELKRKESVLEEEQKNLDLKWKERDLRMGRFKVVKIESIAPFSRGRWTCFDYLDQSENILKSNSYANSQFISSDKNSSGKGKCVRTCPFNNTYESNDFCNLISNNPSGPYWQPHYQEYIYHASGATIIPQQVFTNANKNKLSKSTSLITSDEPSNLQQKNNENNTISNQHIENNQSLGNTAEIINEANEADSSSASVSCTAATIDTKIEHALDVVKNHLTQAVRLEVEELKVKISELVDRISYLEYENDMLRGIIAPDVLANLDNGERDN